MTRDFIRGLPRNLLSSFWGINILWQLLAILATYLLVISGFDWAYFESTRSATLFSLALPAAIIGFFIPVVLPVGLYIWGEIKRKRRFRQLGSAIAQAEIIALLVTVFYKVFTGRTQPEFLTHLSTVDTSREFHFGFLQNGVFWGWPSSHTAVAFAMAGTVWMLLRRGNAWRLVAMGYALYIGIGVSVSIHWFSDVVAGTIIGLLVGVVVGRDFSRVA